MTEILNAKTSFFHLLIVLTFALIFCAAIYTFFIPLIYMLSFGAGESSFKAQDLPIHKFVANWGALIVILAVCTAALIYNIKKQDYRSAKSYLISVVLIFLMYMFRMQIADLLIDFFQ